MKDINDLYCSNCGAPLTKSLISSLKKGKGIICKNCGKRFQLPETERAKINNPNIDSSTLNFELFGLTFKENAIKISERFKKGTKKISEGIRIGTKSFGKGARKAIDEGKKIKKELKKEINKINKKIK
ncbi:MAG: hypothetical protein K9W44_05030 [Candidatus Lokiarchaeota archaeon]|nr:hypothetical protein [Candidatus Harpocratesius repetitus]